MSVPSPVTDADALIMGSSLRVGTTNKFVVLNASANSVKVPTSGAPSPATITLAAIQFNLNGAITFGSVPSMQIVQGTGTASATATVDVASMPADTMQFSVTVTQNGQSYTATQTVNKVRDGVAGTNGTNGSNGTNGTNGAPGSLYALAYLYQWNTGTPSAPTGVSTFDWTKGQNTNYVPANGTLDGWGIGIPSNTNPGSRLYVAIVPLTAAGGTTSATVAYASASIQAWVQNGANGSNGTNGTNGQNGARGIYAEIYLWAASLPGGANAPVGNANWNWANGTADSIPQYWSSTITTPPSPGMTLWKARVYIVDTVTATSTPFSWGNAGITSAGYAGQNGSNGSNGTNGSNGSNGTSYVTAYCASSTGNTTTAPTPTTGKGTLPPQNDGGLSGTWVANVPTLSVGQYLYQIDGIYDPSTNKTTWSIPYWSSLKVGTLSAISANLGQITAGSIDIGTGGASWHVDSLGNQWAGADTFANAPYSVSNAGVVTATNFTAKTVSGIVLFSTGSGLTKDGAAPGTLNSDLAPALASVDTAYLRWDFTNTLNGFAQGNATLTQLPNSITWQPTAANAYLSRSFNTTEQFSGAAYPRVRARVRRTAGSGAWEGNMYYSTASHVAGNSYVKTISAPTDLTQWNILEWDMSALNAGGTDWTDNTITGIRMDLVSSGADGTIFEIDWIAIGVFNSGVSPTTVQAAAAAAQSANSAISDSTSGLAQRMSLNARNVLSGVGGLVAGNLAYDVNGNRVSGYGVAVNQKGIVAFDANGVATFTLDASTGASTMRSITILGDDGSTLFKSSQSLAQQTMVNPNLVSRLSSWPNAGGGAFAQSGASDSRFLNGEYAYLPNNSGLVSLSSSALGIKPGYSYTVSFDAYCVGAARSLNVDVYNGTVDTAGLVVSLTNTSTRYSFTESNSDSSMPSAWLRLFCTAQGSDVVVSNVKVEIGVRATAWCDNIITKSNVSTYIQSAAIGLAYFDVASIGKLSALAADLGTVHINSGGGLSGGSYTGWGWPPRGQSGFYVGPEGALWGNFDDQRWFQIYANGDVSAPGFQLSNKQLTLTNAVIVNPTMSTGFSVSASNTVGGNYANGTTSFGSIVLSVSGGKAPYSYNWTITQIDGPASGFRVDNPSASGVSVSCSHGGVNQSATVSISYTVTDSNNQSITKGYGNTTISWGNGA